MNARQVCDQGNHHNKRKKKHNWFKQQETQLLSSWRIHFYRAWTCEISSGLCYILSFSLGFRLYFYLFHCKCSLVFSSYYGSLVFLLTFPPPRVICHRIPNLSLIFCIVLISLLTRLLIMLLAECFPWRFSKMTKAWISSKSSIVTMDQPVFQARRN